MLKFLDERLKPPRNERRGDSAPEMVEIWISPYLGALVYFQGRFLGGGVFLFLPPIPGEMIQFD